MTPHGAKAKGRTFQQHVRDVFLKVFPSLEPDDIRSTAMGAPGEDIQLSPAARKLLPYNIECKSKARSQVHTYYDQAKSHGKHEPLVIVKMDRSIPLAVISLDHFIHLLTNKNNKTNEIPGSPSI
jgi:hypothetical protein